MKKGCLVSFLTWAALSGAYYYVLAGRFDPPADLWVSIGAGFFMAVVVGTIRIALATIGDMRRFARATEAGDYTAQQPADGETVVAAGHIRAIGPTLRAPFSGTPAVLYMYEMTHVEGDSRQPGEVKDYSGFALTPSVIDTPRGAIRLLSFPQLEGVDKDAPSGDAALANATKYIEETSFTAMGFNPAAIYREVKEMLTDDDGQVRKDWKLRDVADVRDEMLVEQVIAPGEQVCAIGTWSAEKRGLVPHAGVTARLIRGDAAQVARTLRGKLITNLIIAIVFACVVNGILYAIVTRGRFVHPARWHHSRRSRIESIACAATNIPRPNAT